MEYLKFWWLSMRNAVEPLDRSARMWGKLSILAFLFGGTTIPLIFEPIRRWLQSQNNYFISFYLDHFWIGAVVLIFGFVVFWGCYKTYSNERIKRNEAIVKKERYGWESVKSDNGFNEMMLYLSFHFRPKDKKMFSNLQRITLIVDDQRFEAVGHPDELTQGWKTVTGRFHYWPEKKDVVNMAKIEVLVDTMIYVSNPFEIIRGIDKPIGIIG